MLHDTVRQSAGLPGTPSPRKLRDSCNDCASSKVRCSKQKPTCARCARRGVTCTYLASRRTGRSSANASKSWKPQVWLDSTTTGFEAGRPGLSGPARSLPNGASPQSSANTKLDALPNGSQHSPNLGTDVWLPILSPIDVADEETSLSLPSLTCLEDSVDNSLDYRLRPSPLFDCLGRPSTAGSSFYPTISNLEVDRFLSDMVSNPGSDVFPPTPTISGSNPAPGHPGPDSCCTIILSILSRVLAQIPSSCARSRAPVTLGSLTNVLELTNPTAFAAETMVPDNKQIIDSLTSLLDCPCTQEGHLVSLMALVARKVLERYATWPTKCIQRATQSSMASSSSPTSSSSPSSTPTTISSTTSPTSLPLTVSPRDISSPTSSHLHSTSSNINPAAPPPPPPPTRGTIWPGSTPSSESSSPTTGIAPDSRALFTTSFSSSAAQPDSSWTPRRETDNNSNNNSKPTDPSLLFQAAQLVVVPPTSEAQRAQGLLDVLRARLEGIRARAGSGRAGAGAGAGVARTGVGA